MVFALQPISARTVAYMNFVIFFSFPEEIVRGTRFAFVLLSCGSEATAPNSGIRKISRFQRDFKKERPSEPYRFSRKLLSAGGLSGWEIALTALLLALGRRYQSVETDALVELDAKDQSDFEQYTLKLSNANVVDGAGAKFPEEFFRPQGAKVVDDEGPQVKDVVPGHTIPFLYNDYLGS